MKQPNPSVLILIAFILFAIAAIQALSLSNAQVLGLQSGDAPSPQPTRPIATPTLPSYQSVPCSKLEFFYRSYCSNVYPTIIVPTFTPSPSRYPTPTKVWATPTKAPMATPTR